MDSGAQPAMKYSLLDAGTQGLVGQALLAKRRENRVKMFCALMAAYMLFGMASFYFVEGWGPLNSVVFCLSIITGVGYGHLTPQEAIGKILTSIYIILGLVFFATVAGTIMDYLMAKEIEMMEAMLKADADNEGQDAEAKKLTYREKQKQEKFYNFKVGAANASILYFLVLVVYMFVYQETFVNALLLSSISVMKLDSLCVLNGVTCSAGWHAHGGGKHLDVALAIVFYIVTYGVIGHFTVATINYFGLDEEHTMTKVRGLNHNRLKEFDNDGDGKVTRSEFLCNRLIKAQICNEVQLKRMLKNFDDLDKDGSGTLTQKDLDNMPENDS
mmetsp:Transcript_102464/g.264959  ORF Transcript_102464/g.264959 Transcript_102464/m.264959 type:complete len:329 (-) Transcript_102464:151-1137(-)